MQASLAVLISEQGQITSGDVLCAERAQFFASQTVIACDEHHCVEPGAVGFRGGQHNLEFGVGKWLGRDLDSLDCHDFSISQNRII